MLYLLALHIAALVFWGSAQLYLPALIGASHRRPGILLAPRGQASMAHFLFTHVSTPAGLLAIVAGTGVFLLDRTVEGWLAVKLGLVSLLALAHIGTGLLLLRARQHPERPVLPWCWVLGIVSALLLGIIIWLVLAKPGLGSFA